MRPRGPGRPEASPREKKSAIFSVRLSQEERQQVEDAANSVGLKGSAWARLALIDAAAEAWARAGRKP
jgi:mobilization protein NikA